MEERASRSELTISRVAILIGIGLASGFFAGLFGIGGGVMVVPALVVLLGFDHRQAVATSLLAILPAVATSTVSYALAGSVDWTVGAIVAVGAVIGAQVGAWVLQRISRRSAQWIFVVFLISMIIQLLLVVPNREATIELSLPMGAGLLLLGLVAGSLSAILGIGGGGVAVPILMVWFGLGDIAAKGVSLVMMLPGVLSGLVANLRRRQVEVRAGLVVGAGALLTGPVGAWVAHIISPQVGAWLFAAFLIFIAVTMVREALRPASLDAGRSAD
jgi:uncharacterized protein